MPFTYGTYRWSVQSIAVKDASGNVLSNRLDKDLVLGLFTWDSTEDYASHENWNHEVDVEISQWGDSTNEDVQFVVQPPETPHYYRFWSGSSSGGSVDQGGHSYEFTWLPTSISWYTTAGGGVSYEYTTKQARSMGLEDRIQCLPANVEIRINLWNMNGAVAPSSLSSTDYVEVVIDDFEFVPSDLQGAAGGSICSKSCQCVSGACSGGYCTA
jgi:hypothetical protein